MGKIEVNGIELYAYHGCMEEEAKLGGKYRVDVAVEADLNPSAITDDLNKTVDYVKIYNVVQKEMSVRSKLIETVAKRISDKIKMIPGVRSGSVTIKKLNAPIGGPIEYVSVTFPF